MTNPLKSQAGATSSLLPRRGEFPQGDAGQRQWLREICDILNDRHSSMHGDAFYGKLHWVPTNGYVAIERLPAHQ